MKYFTYHGIKYIITYDNKKLIISKFENNKVISLNEAEKIKIHNLLHRYKYIYNSAYLNEIIASNPELNKYNNVDILLNWIESIIPGIYRENFYKKLKTLKIDLNLDAINMPEIPNERYKEIGATGNYNAKDNTIIFNREAVKVVYQIAHITKNPEDYFTRDLIHTLVHELLHMASANYDHDKNISLTGFDKYPSENIAEKNRGLTEGFTELLASIAIPSNHEIASGYFIEECLILQLIALLGGDELLKICYFGNKGTRPLEEKLEQIDGDQAKSFALFRDIEIYYCIENDNEPQNLFAHIQSSLLDYLDELLENYPNPKDLLNAYEPAIITPEKIKLMDKNPDNYIDLEESVAKFYHIKDKYMKKYRT